MKSRVANWNLTYFVSESVYRLLIRNFSVRAPSDIARWIDEEYVGIIRVGKVS